VGWWEVVGRERERERGGLRKREGKRNPSTFMMLMNPSKLFEWKLKCQPK
jgi:hypothetical protein